MVRNFKELEDKMDARMTPDERAAHKARVTKAVAAMRLEQMRRNRDLTQVELANRLGIDQGSVSRIEKQVDMHLSTLRGYVEAAGGRLELQAIFPGHTMTLNVGNEAKR
jgi:predicted transcriptional regulator